MKCSTFIQSHSHAHVHVTDMVNNMYHRTLTLTLPNTLLIIKDSNLDSCSPYRVLHRTIGS